MALLYVSTTGIDTNSGAIGSPFKSLTKAASMAKPGDTVLVAGGTYNGLVQIAGNGAAGSQITFKPMDGQKVVIDGAGTPSGTNLVTITGDYVTFQGFEVKNAAMAGIVGFDAHDLKIVDNKVHDTYRNAIFTASLGSTITSYNNVIEGNEVWATNKQNEARTSTGGWGQAISVLRTDNAVIKGNYVHDNWGEGLVSIASKGTKITDNIVRDNYSVQVYLDNAQDAVVQNNTIYHTYKTQFYRYNKPAQGVQIANEDGYGRYLPSSGITVTDNVMGGVGSPIYLGYGLGGGLTNSVIAPNTIYATPEPVIAANPNPAPSIPGSTPTPVEPDPAPAPEGVVTKVGTGSDTLVLKITQDAYQGDAKYVVLVDGKQFGGEFTAKALHNSGQFDTLEIKGDWGVGNHTVSVKLLNDLYGGSATADRNVYVESATYNSVAVSGSYQYVNAGTKSFTVADTTATPTTPATTPAPTPTPTPPAPGLNLQGTGGNDTMNGASLNDSLAGLGGNDFVYGRGGNDTLSGGDGSDKLIGNDGNDVLSGGNGSDWFIFSSSSIQAGGVDRITDFNSADDQIDLGYEFAALTNANLRADEFRLGSKAADANDRIIYDKATGGLFYDADGTGAAAQVKFAQLTPNTSLEHWDFYVW